VLRSAIAAANAAPEGDVGAIGIGGGTMPIPRYSPIVPNTSTTGNIAAMALYAGESVTHVTSVQPAAAIIAELVAGAERLIRSR
jgi:hypothetical protein